jgi:hypothetical protein
MQNTILEPFLRSASPLTLAVLVGIVLFFRYLPDLRLLLHDIIPQQRRLTRVKRELEMLTAELNMIELVKHHLPLPEDFDSRLVARIQRLIISERPETVASLPKDPSKPSRWKVTLVGFCGGLTPMAFQTLLILARELAREPSELFIGLLPTTSGQLLSEATVLVLVGSLGIVGAVFGRPRDLKTAFFLGLILPFALITAGNVMYRPPGVVLEGG